MIKTVAHEVLLRPVPGMSAATVWFQCTTGREAAIVDGQRVFGVCVPFDKAVCLSAVSMYQVRAVKGEGHIMACRAAIECLRPLVSDLAHLEFPLEAAELEVLSLPRDEAACLRSNAPVPDPALTLDVDVTRLAVMEPDVGTGTSSYKPQNPFEEWMVDRVLSIEKTQSVILHLLQSRSVSERATPMPEHKAVDRSR
eukprot:1696561-Amphidinium_carterae.4